MGLMPIESDEPYAVGAAGVSNGSSVTGIYQAIRVNQVPEM